MDGSSKDFISVLEKINFKVNQAKEVLKISIKLN